MKLIYYGENMIQTQAPKTQSNERSAFINKQLMGVFATAALAGTMMKNKTQTTSTNAQHVLRCINSNPSQTGSILDQQRQLFRIKVTISDIQVFESAAVVSDKEHLAVMIIIL